MSNESLTYSRAQWDYQIHTLRVQIHETLERAHIAIAVIRDMRRGTASWFNPEEVTARQLEIIKRARTKASKDRKVLKAMLSSEARTLAEMLLAHGSTSTVSVRRGY